MKQYIDLPFANKEKAKKSFQVFKNNAGFNKNVDLKFDGAVSKWYIEGDDEWVARGFKNIDNLAKKAIGPTPEQIYDLQMNEGGEGYNPYRD